MRRQNRWQRGVVIAIAIIALAALVLPMAITSWAEEETEEPAGGSGAAQAPELVVIGTTGLRWEDLSALATPHLWDLADDGASANLVARSVRSFSCPADGWLAMSAGRRAADLPMEEFGTCRRLQHPEEDGGVPGWEAYQEAAARDGYDATPGLLAEVLADNDHSALAVGPGAAIALADQEGRMGADYLPAPPAPSLLTSSLTEALPGQDLVVVDVGSVRDHNRPLVSVPADQKADPDDEPGPRETPEPPAREAWMLATPQRSEQVAAIDARVGAVVDAVRELGDETTIVLASIADSGSQARMQLVVAEGPGVSGWDEVTTEGGGLLNSRATRQPGMIQATDLAPTILRALDIGMPRGLVGSPAYATADDRATGSRVAALADENAHAVAVRPLRGAYHSALVIMNLLLYATVTVGLNRRVLDRAAGWLARRRSAPAVRVAGALRSRSPRAALRAIRAVAVTVAAVPVASYLANLLPWWRSDNPPLVVLGSTALIAVALAALALAPPWRNPMLTPVAVVAGTTAAVLTVDALTGTRLQVAALMGIQPEVGGRFYGFNNTSFSLFAASIILTAICLTDPLVRAGRRWLAAGIVLVMGAVGTILVGHPSIGADFGGPPALIPGTLVLALLIAGIRLTWLRMAVVLGTTFVLALAFSVVDYLRPPEDRTHTGRFIETVLDGGAVTVIGRNLSQNLTNLFGSTLTFLAIGGIVVVVLLMTRPLREAARSREGGAYGWLAGDGTTVGADRLAQMLRPALVSLAVTLGIGFAVNDSGIVLPAIGISLSVPLLVAVLTGWLLARGGSAGPATAPSAQSAEDAEGGEPAEPAEDSGSAQAR